MIQGQFSGATAGSSPPRGWTHVGGFIVALALIFIGTAFRARQFITYSLWLDEAWVGVDIRARTWHEFLLALASTPPLFALSVRFVYSVFQHPDLGARFLPLAFSIVALALAFRLGKELQGTLGGLFALALIALHPAMIDYAKQLKQYSSDIAFALAVVWLGLRFLSNPTPTNALLLAPVATVAPGFSYTALFVNLALLVGLAVYAIRSRDRRHIACCLSICTPVVVSSLALFLFSQRYDNALLRAYWQGSYLPVAPIEATKIGFDRLVRLLSPGPGLGRVLLIAGGGLLLSMLLKRNVAGVVLVVLVPIESAGAAMMQRYPFGDIRTDLYLTALLLCVAGAGIGLLVASVGRLSRPLALIALILLTVWWGSKISWSTLGQFAPVEEAGPLVRYIEQNREPGDTVVLYYSSLFAFAYYSSEPWTIEPTNLNTVGIQLAFTNPRIVLLPDHRDHEAAYDADVRRIVEDAGTGRIWLLMSHLYGDEGSYIPMQFGHYGRIATALPYPNALLCLIVKDSTR